MKEAKALPAVACGKIAVVDDVVGRETPGYCYC